MEAKDVVTFVIALIGAVTGVTGTVVSVLNYLRQSDRDRVKIRIGVREGIMSTQPGSPFLAVSVTNLSAFPVRIKDVGLLGSGKAQRVLDLTVVAKIGLGVSLEPRTSTDFHFSPEFLALEQTKDAICAYVRTDCGEQFESGHSDIPLMIRDARKRALPSG